MQDKNNPFYGEVYKGPELFCDREEESELLKKYMRDGINVTLFAMRRIGKTGLIHHVFHPYKKNSKVICVYLDILATNDLTQFTNALATAIYNRFPSQNKLAKRIFEGLKRFRPTINFDELTGAPSISFSFETEEKKQTTIGNILKFLDDQEVRIVIALDEFQQILEYPEQNVEAILRTHMQSLKNTTFIFCGSNQQMMHEIFNSAKRPFYASCTNMFLDKIDESKYKRFIRKQFERKGAEIDEECIDFICSWTNRHTFYTQYFCYVLYSMNYKQNKLEHAKMVAVTILKHNENVFYQYKNLLTKSQWELLVAIGKEEKVFQPSSNKFIKKYKLGAASSVNRSLQALLEKEMIYHQSAIEQPYYSIYDNYLMRWLQQLPK